MRGKVRKTMTKDILISIRGLQSMGDDQQEDLEMIIPGSYYKKGDRHYIKYNEVTEGMEGTTSNLIKIKGNCMEVTKRALPIPIWYLRNRRRI